LSSEALRSIVAVASSLLGYDGVLLEEYLQTIGTIRGYINPMAQPHFAEDRRRTVVV